MLTFPWCRPKVQTGLQFGSVEESVRTFPWCKPKVQTGLQFGSAVCTTPYVEESGSPRGLQKRSSYQRRSSYQLSMYVPTYVPTSYLHVRPKFLSQTPNITTYYYYVLLLHAFLVIVHIIQTLGPLRYHTLRYTPPLCT